MSRWRLPLISRWAVKTQGSVEHCVKPHCRSQGNRERCHRRPACAMPYRWASPPCTRVRVRPTQLFRNLGEDGNTRPPLAPARPAGRQQ
eukprot:252826-Pleurochrysis_carterae.AAC.1